MLKKQTTIEGDCINENEQGISDCEGELGLWRQIAIDKKIFVTHGVNDNVISINEARESKKMLEEKGFDLDYKEYPIAHEITLEVISDVQNWMNKILD